MFWYYLKTAFKNLGSNKKFSIINIAGFAFGLSVCMAIALFLIKEYSYNGYHEHADQIVRLIDTKNNSSSIDYRVKDILLNNYSEIKNSCLVQRIGSQIDVKVGDNGFYLDDIMSVDNHFFEIFDVSFISGKSVQPFANLQSAILTESTARFLFGTEDPLGKELLIWGGSLVTVVAIIKDFPENSSISAGLLVNADNDDFKFAKSIGNSDDLSTYRWPFQIYLQLNKNVNQKLLIDKINERNELLQPYQEKVGFLTLKDIYLHDTTSGSQLKKGNADLLKLLTVIAFIILTLAVINYVNLSVAQQNKRNKDTGVKKTIGASRNNILLHFLFESSIVTFLAFFVGLMLLLLFLPVFHTVFNTTIEPKLLLQFPVNILLFGFILLVGLVSGIGPAMVLSGVNPVKILSGSAISNRRSYSLRNALTVFQFATSIVLILCVIVVQRQINFVKHKNPGFNQEQLLRLDLPGIQEQDEQKVLALMTELEKSPYIKSLSVTGGVPGKIYMHMGSNMENTAKNMSVPCLIVDTSFMETFGLEVVKGRNLEPGDYGNVCMINQAAYKHFEFDDLGNKRFNNWKTGGLEIIGVVNDFHYSSMHETIGPICIIFSENQQSTINIRFIAGHTGQGMQFINKSWQEILQGYPLNYQFYDEWFNSMYRSEERFAQTIGIFSILAIVISCIGILGLAIFTSERRVKEIGIRKINGAKVWEVMAMLNKDFVKWVAIAFVIASPIAWYAMNKWLESFAYKTELSWWIFALAGVMALGIALLTVSFQSWRAATRNPVEALRYE